MEWSSFYLKKKIPFGEKARKGKQTKTLNKLQKRIVVKAKRKDNY
jgi:hypothetical protein